MSGYLVGQLLVAMPQMRDTRFARSVIYLCAHSAEGAMGLVVNKLFGSLTFPDLLEQLNIEATGSAEPIRVHFGGPVESGRGFVLHSDDYKRDGTMIVEPGYCLTATVDILKAIAQGDGPRKSFLALGYAGWGPGQLESKISANGWLNAPPDLGLVFDGELDSKWQRAISKLGADISMLSHEAGHA